jgi:nicotinate-nucleotide adenylyltransferase
MLQEEYPEDELYLIVGADIVNSIKDWHEGEWILENFNLITIARQGSEVEAVIKKTINVSSTEIRTLISNGKQIYPLVPKVIAQYIKRYNLYKK